MILTGRAVVLRPLTIEDANLTLSWRLSQRARLMQRGAQTVEQQTAWILGREKYNDLNFIMEYREEPVGMIALLEWNSVHKSIQMGRLLIGAPDKVGSAPVAFESELLLCDYAFDTLQAHSLYGDVLEENIAMLRTRLYLGYKKDGLLREHYNYDGIYKNAVMVSILENEYHKICRPKLIELIDLFLATNPGKNKL